MKEVVESRVNQIEEMLHGADEAYKTLQKFFEDHELLACLAYPDTTPFDNPIVYAIHCIERENNINTQLFEPDPDREYTNIYALVCATSDMSDELARDIVGAVDVYFNTVTDILDDILVNLDDLADPYIRDPDHDYGDNLIKMAVSSMAYAINKRLSLVMYGYTDKNSQMREFIGEVLEKQQSQDNFTGATFEMIPRFHHIVEQVMETYYIGRNI